MNVLGRFEDFIRLAVGPVEAAVMPVIVMQVQAQIVREPFQATRQVVYARVTAKLDRNGLGRDTSAAVGDVRLRGIVVVAIIPVIAAVPMAIVMRHDMVPIGVVIVSVIFMVIEMGIMIVITSTTDVNPESKLRAGNSGRPQRRQTDNRDDSHRFEHLNGPPRRSLLPLETSTIFH
jgi:hypothetical protein